MLDKILAIDSKLFLYLNSLHSEYLDQIMLFVSNSIIPCIIIIFSFLIFGYKKFRKSVVPLFIFLLISFGLSDSISSKILKPSTQRLRPCHVENLEVYTAQNNCGGDYGFVSSHASNSFAVLFFIFLLFKGSRKRNISLLVYAALVSYSRVYLGRHYPLDITFGATLGIVIPWIIYCFISKKTNLLKSQ
jgi:undecaprenyl-diphosphatase